MTSAKWNAGREKNQRHRLRIKQNTLHTNTLKTAATKNRCWNEINFDKQIQALWTFGSFAIGFHRKIERKIPMNRTYFIQSRFISLNTYHIMFAFIFYSFIPPFALFHSDRLFHHCFPFTQPPPSTIPTILSSSSPIPIFICYQHCSRFIPFYIMISK